jgi:hypothetical protein
MEEELANPAFVVHCFQVSSLNKFSLFNKALFALIWDITYWEYWMIITSHDAIWKAFFD